MAIYSIENRELKRLDETTFPDEGIRERQDLQHILKTSIEVIAPNTKVIAEEFGEWSGSQRRIDLLAIDKDANLVVIELKRTQDGGHMELQALRYASMISAMTFSRAVEVYADYSGQESLSDAEEDILNFLEWESPSDDDFANDVHIVLASGEFSRELTTSVLWLNDHGLNIRCIRLKPYRSETGILVNIEQIIPLPEAEEYQVKVRQKRDKQRLDRTSNRDATRRDLRINGKLFPNLPKRRIIYEVVAAALENGAAIEDIRAGMANTKWVEIDGELDSESFIAASADIKTRTGSAIDIKRFFTNDDELFHINGKTYALSKMWGKGTQLHVSKLEDKYQLDLEIDW